MLTTEQIILVIFMVLWILVSILTYVLLLRHTRKEYKKFYPHPIVNIVKELNSNNKFKFWEKLFIFTCLNIIYLPIICKWLIAWCLYKFCKNIYDDTQKDVIIDTAVYEDRVNRSTKEIEEPNLEYQKRLKENLRQLDEALNNPEAMPIMMNKNDSVYSDNLIKFLKLSENKKEETKPNDSNNSHEM